MTDFGTRLKRARKLRHITQKELAERLGVEQSAISNYETNFRLPVASALMEIANQLNVSVEYLLGGEELTELKVPEVSELQQLQEEFMADLLAMYYTDAFNRIHKIANEGVGILELYQYVFEPTLKTVGELWASGKISIADEHIISDLIDRALVSLSDQRKSTLNQTPKFTAAFMLPGAEMHEFPLKMTSEIFKSAGWTNYYIGKSIPLFSLQYFLENNKIDVLVFSVTLKEHLNSCESLIQLVKGMRLENPPLILLGGSAIENENIARQILAADLYFDSLQDLKDGMDALETQLS